MTFQFYTTRRTSEKASPTTRRVMIMYKTKKAPVTYPGMPMLQTGLHYTAEDSQTRGDMEILPFCFSMNDSFVTASKSNGSQLPALPSFFRHPLRTLAAMRGISVKRLIEQARRGRDLMIGASLQAALSKGEMRLVSADPYVQPELHYNYLSDPFDRQRMREGRSTRCRTHAGQSVYGPRV